jgi:hexosaminidase
MKALSYDPYLNLTSTAERDLVVGGQTSLWAEQTDANNIEAQLWPRAAAFAEVFWSGGGAKGFPRDPISAVGRINDVRYRLDARGIRAVPIQPEWCALRPGECLLE